MPATDATKFADSWSRYTVSVPAITAELTAYWTQTFLQLDIVSAGRNGNALKIYFGSYIFKTLPHASSWVVGFAFKAESGNGGGALLNLQNNDDAVPFALGTNFDNTLTIYAGGVGGPIIGTSNKAIHRNQWYYAEVVVSYAVTGGTIHTTGQLFINGESWIGPATVDTGLHTSQTLSGDATTNVVMLQAGVLSAGDTLFDDFYARSGTSSRFGDVKILGIVPNGDVVSDFTPNSAGSHFSHVNEIPFDGDTTYVSDGTIGDKDIWDWQDIPSFSGTLQSVVISICARKDDEGSKAFQIVAGDTGTDDHSEDFYLGDSYIYFHTAWDEIPGGGSWTRAAFNAERFGVKVIV